jgi:hypothetical protein
MKSSRLIEELPAVEFRDVGMLKSAVPDAVAALHWRERLASRPTEWPCSRTAILRKSGGRQKKGRDDPAKVFRRGCLKGRHSMLRRSAHCKYKIGNRALRFLHCLVSAAARCVPEFRAAAKGAWSYR